jgi:SAM-dependent methyltransferase
MERSVTVTAAPRRGVPGFGAWVAQSCPPGATVLNIGGGQNLSGQLRPLRRRAGCLVGVDPDASICENPTLDEFHQQTLEDFATTHAGCFDLAFSVFVLEHVHDPMPFTRACARVLRPRGVLMGITVNKWQYFGLCTWAATRLGLADRLLPMVRREGHVAGHVEGHRHFPTQYRCNSVRTLTRLLDEAGFSRAEFRCWDLPRMYEPYLPGPLRGFARRYNRVAYGLERPNLMGHITFRATL